MFHKRKSSAQPVLKASDYCLEGKKQLNMGSFSQALEYFQAAIEVDKDCLDAWLELRKIYNKKGDLSKVADCDIEIKRIRAKIYAPNVNPSQIANNAGYNTSKKIQSQAKSKSSYIIALVCWLIFIVAIVVFLWQTCRISYWEVWGGFLAFIGTIGVCIVELLPVTLILLFIAYY